MKNRSLPFAKYLPAICVLACLAVHTSALWAQQSSVDGQPLSDRERMLMERIERLEQRLSALENQRGGSQPAVVSANAAPPSASPVPAQVNAPAAVVTQDAKPAPPSSPLAFSDGTTINFVFDGYYGYNFNHPVGRVNLLRANDVTANTFSLSNAGVVVEKAPDVEGHRRWGYRLDLMFGQLTDTIQGSSINENRPQIYRNIFQAYGSYVLPIGSGLQIDFGKFASSLGMEGTYAKDQLNYSRSYYYNFLPFYHEGLRATYNVNKRLSLQYWLVNGANQTEDFNGYKSQAAILIFKPTKNISWSVNYYEGQEQRDTVPQFNQGLPTLPTQPGLSTTPITMGHDGRYHVLDSYASFVLGSKWSAALEGDYVINRVAANSAPTHVYGGVGYVHRQITKDFAVNGRFEYLADRGGLFSGQTQDLKALTLTGSYQFADGFQGMLEYRRDFSNRPFFLTNDPLRTVGSQDSVTLGLLWWFGGKQGAW